MPPLDIEPGTGLSTPKIRSEGFFSRPEVRISTLYVVIGSLWIIGSDALLSQLVNGNCGTIFFHAFKGLNFVLTTGLLLFFVLRRSFGGWRKSEELRISQALTARARFQKLSLILICVQGETFNPGPVSD